MYIFSIILIYKKFILLKKSKHYYSYITTLFSISFDAVSFLPAIASNSSINSIDGIYSWALAKRLLKLFSLSPDIPPVISVADAYIKGI